MSQVTCPACKFGNAAGAIVCLTCKAPLAGAEAPAQPTSKLNATNVDLRNVVAWLACEPLDPVPIVQGAAVTVGRSPDCDLVLRHKSVSRLQAVIKAHGKTLDFTDEGSSNGTFLNGKRTAAGALKAGDVLSFGPYEVEVHSNDSIASLNKEMDMEGTQVIEVSSLATGFLHEASLAELLQGIEFNRKSGTLKILSGSVRGTLHVEQGRPVRAVLGSDIDEEAAIRMLTLREGRYTFSSDVEPGQPTMAGTITGLLLEASRRADQGEG